MKRAIALLSAFLLAHLSAFAASVSFYVDTARITVPTPGAQPTVQMTLYHSPSLTFATTLNGYFYWQGPQMVGWFQGNLASAGSYVADIVGTDGQHYRTNPFNFVDAGGGALNGPGWIHGEAFPNLFSPITTLNGNHAITGTLDIDGNKLTLGTQLSNPTLPGFTWDYIPVVGNSTLGTLASSTSHSAGSWTWVANGSTLVTLSPTALTSNVPITISGQTVITQSALTTTLNQYAQLNQPVSFSGITISGSPVVTENTGTGLYVRKLTAAPTLNSLVGPGTTISGATSSVVLGFGADASPDMNVAAPNANSSVSIGNGSRAGNTNALAIGTLAVATGGSNAGSIALGTLTRAEALGSVGVGSATEAKGEYSIALGGNTFGLGYGAIAIGRYAQAGPPGAVASAESSAISIGEQSAAEGAYASAFGPSSRAIGYGSLGLGLVSRAEGRFSTAIGVTTTAKGYWQTVLGFYNTLNGDPQATDFNPNGSDLILLVGNGSAAEPSNALAIRKDAGTAIGTGVVSSAGAQVVVGRHNITNANGVFVVGAGAGAGTPLNAMRVKDNGTVLIQPSGDIGMGPYTGGDTP